MAKTYNPNDYALLVGAAQMQGFGEDQFVEVEFNKDQVELTVGVDGEGMRAIGNDRSARIKFTLLQGSLSNDYLSALALLDRATGAGQQAFYLKDLRGGATAAHAENVWVRKVPKVTLARGVEVREWELETDRLDEFVGGTLT